MTRIHDRTPSLARAHAPLHLAFAVAMLCALAPALAHAKRVIHVADVQGLYTAVGEPANAGAVVTLAPGRYVLDPGDGVAGRLELQRDMELQGVPGDPEQVIVDASALPPGSFSIPPYTTGAIRLGRGSNAVAWLTVQGARNGASAINTDLVAPGRAQVRIAHVLVRDGVRGLDVRNLGAPAAGRTLEVSIADSIFIDHVIGAGQGLRLANVDAHARRSSPTCAATSPTATSPDASRPTSTRSERAS